MVLVSSGCFRLVCNRFSTVSAHVAFSEAISASDARIRVSEARYAARTARNPLHPPQDEKAASYSRFSSEQQRETSITDQQRTCRDAANTLGLQIELEFADNAISGTTISRTGLDEMVERAERGEFSVLYVHSLSRLSRETTHVLPLLKKLVFLHKVRLISVVDGIDSVRVDWYDVAVHTSISDEKFLRTLSANVHRGQSGNVLDGFSAGDTRYGYTSKPCPKGTMVGRGRYAVPRNVYAILETEAIWVRKIFDWFVRDRQKLAWIVRELNRSLAPKSSRSKRPYWYRDLVSQILRSEKYIGIWPWGRTKVITNPVTGKKEKVLRKESEYSKWTRLRPDLQIVDDTVFETAQRLLDEQSDRFKGLRGDDGKLRGGPKGHRGTHLLAGLLRCSVCGSALGCYDQRREYVVCPGRIRGYCSMATRARREIVERRVVLCVQQNLINNAVMVETICVAAKGAWHAANDSRPDHFARLDEGRRALLRKIERLVDSIEESAEADPGLAARLAQRRRELKEVELEIRRIQDAPRRCDEEPTKQWIIERLTTLTDILMAGTPADWKAFQDLIDGPLILEPDVSVSTGQQYLKTVLSLSSERISSLLVGDEGSRDAEKVVVQIPLEFRRELKTERQAREAHRLWGEGASCQSIASKLGVSESRVAAVFSYAEDKLGLPRPNCRPRSYPDSIYNRLESAVMNLYDKKTMIQEIAQQLGVSRQTVRQILIRWHRKNGLSMPDGRSRRKDL